MPNSKADFQNEVPCSFSDSILGHRCWLEAAVKQPGHIQVGLGDVSGPTPLPSGVGYLDPFQAALFDYDLCNLRDGAGISRSQVIQYRALLAHRDNVQHRANAVVSRHV